MSTKWSPKSILQQTPPICKKPPGVLPVPTPPFNTRTLQCFGLILSPPVTPPFSMTGIFDLPPELPDTTWENGTNNILDNIAVLVFSAPPYTLFDVTIDGFRGVTLLATHTWTNVEPRNISPFELPFLEHDDVSPQRHYEVKATE